MVRNSMANEESISLHYHHRHEEEEDDPDVVSVDESSEEDEDDSGVYAFSQLKNNAEVQKLRNDSSDGGCHQKKERLKKLEDWFSMSSLELDDVVDEFGDHEDGEDGKTNNKNVPQELDDDDDDMAISRFSAISVSRRGIMDIIPALPTSSSERQHLLMKRVVSCHEIRVNERQHLQQQSLSERQPSPKSEMVTDQPSPAPTSHRTLRSTLRESRWSSSSSDDRNMKDDALDVLLDRVSTSYHDGAKSSFMVDDETMSITTRGRMSASAVLGANRHADDVMWTPIVSPREHKNKYVQYSMKLRMGDTASPPRDQRWQHAARIPSDTLPSPARLRR